MREALLIIDMQRGFTDPVSSLCIKGAAATVPACARAAGLARERGVPVFWVIRGYRADGTDVEKTRAAVWEAGGKPLSPGAPDEISARFAEGLEAADGDFIIVKPRFSAFFATPLDLYLRRLGVTGVVLAGTTTPNCIRCTCYDALSLDYDVTVLSDCCSSNTPEIQRANLEDMERIGARVITLGEWQ
ncbi:MAG: cysteine hydrolase family protein [Anaerovoracaceae bacterium]|jgi:nicotinamidase-related amidase